MYSNKVKLSVMAFMLLLILSAAQVMAAANLSFQTSTDGGAWQLSWDQTLTVDVEQEGRELILRFNHSLGELDLASLQQAFPGLIESARYGYDSLVVRVAPQVEQTVLVRKRSVNVQLRVQPTHEPLCAQGQLSPAARMRYLSAVAQLELGHLDSARSELHALSQDCPDSGEVLAASGRLEERAGRWFLALDHYSKARAAGFTQHTTSEDALRRKHDAHAEFKTLRSEEKQDARRISKQFHIKQRVAGDKRLNLTMSHHEVRRARAQDGAWQPDVSIQEGRFSVEDIMGERNHQEFALSFLPGVIGAGYRYQFLADAARTDFSAQINTLDTTDLERMAAEGRRDNISVQQSRYRSDALSVTYGVDVVRYHGVSDQHYWAGGYMASADYLLLQEPVDLLAKYVLDGESVREKTADYVSEPVPDDFENHSLAGVLSSPWMNRAHLTLELGYTWDRLGGEGPYQAFNISALPGAWAHYAMGIRHGQRDNSAADDDILEVEFTLQVPF